MDGGDEPFNHKKGWVTRMTDHPKDFTGAQELRTCPECKHKSLTVWLTYPETRTTPAEYGSLCAHAAAGIVVTNFWDDDKACRCHLPCTQ